MKRSSALFLLALASVALAAPKGTSKASSEALRKRATKLYKKGNYAEACALFDQVSKGSDDAGLFSDLGLCLARSQHPTEAKKALYRAIELAQNEASIRLSAYFNLGLLMNDAVTPSAFHGGGLSRDSTCQSLQSTNAQCATALKACVTYRDGSSESEQFDEMGCEKVPDGIWDISVGAEKLEWESQLLVGGCTRVQPQVGHAQDYECSIVWVDGCAGRLGIVCSRCSGKEPCSQAAYEVTRENSP